MKLAAAFSTLVTLTTLASAAPNSYPQYLKRQSFNDTNTNTTNPNGGGVGAAPNSLPVTQTVTQTVVSTVAQQYTTFLTTELITATLVFPGGAGVGAVPTGLPGTSPVSGGSGVAPGSAPGVAPGSGSGIAPGSGVPVGDTCVCAGSPAVVATGIYTVAVATVVDLGTSTYTTVNPSTTLGLMTISGGQIQGAVSTVTSTGVIATNTNAPLGPGQSYQIITIPGSNGAPTITVVIVVTVVVDVVVPTNGGSGVDAGSGNLPTSSAPFSNSSTASTSASFSPSSTLAAVGAPEAGTTQTSVPLPAATTAPAAQETLAPGTQAAQVGSLGTTPLVNQANFVADMVNAHNQYRARHGLQGVTWSEQLAAVALANVNANAAAGTFKHTNEMAAGSDPYGENLGVQYGANNPDTLVYLWYDEITKYSYANPGFSGDTGHFTQVVWDNSDTIGCAYVQTTDANGRYLLACEYNAPGNIVGSTQAETAASFTQHVPQVIPGAAPYSQPAANAA